MRVYIVRHGIAEPRGTEGNDFDRQLTPDGVEKTGLVCKALEVLGAGKGRILSSPYLRAMQTAEIVAKYLPKGCKVDEAGWLAEPFEADRVFGALARVKGETVYLVGHEPFMSDFIGAAIAPGSTANVQVKKAAVASLVFDGKPGVGKATLEWLAPPKILTRVNES